MGFGLKTYKIEFRNPQLKNWGFFIYLILIIILYGK
tara:strand:+ start:20525 stop:20632 length:108 start_codon:yes stop_codon:yes gene_type:complete